MAEFLSKLMKCFALLYPLLLIVGWWGYCNANDSASSHTVRVKSLRQKMLSQRELVLSGDVDFLLKQRLHIFADQLYFDTQQQFARAQAMPGNDVVLQDEQLLVFAQRCSLYASTGEVIARDARVQMAEGFFTAQELYRDEEGIWWAKQVGYTPCDACSPHWQVQAEDAVYSSSYLELEKIKFLVNKTPIVWLPGAIVPRQKKAQSGFLVPRFSLDYRYGLGVRQDYYWYIHEHADITTGVDWKNGRGVFGTSEVRWAASPQHRGYFKGYGGYAEQLYVQRRDSIVQTGRPQFLLQGNHACGSSHIAGLDYVSALTVVDYGSDKKIGYEFYDRIEDVDDTFYNGVLVRCYASRGIIQGSCDTAETSRKRFFLSSLDRLFTPAEQNDFVLLEPVSRAVQEFDNRSNVAHLGQITWAGLMRRAGCIGYKDTCLLDYTFMRDQETERIFLLSKLAREERIMPRESANALRLVYEGDLTIQVPTEIGSLVCSCKPQLNVRSRVNVVAAQQSSFVDEHSIFGHGAYRTLLHADASYRPPLLEIIDQGGGGVATLQPQLYLRAAPIVAQRGWPLFDRFDRSYPTGEFGVGCDYACKIGVDQTVSGYAQQGYDVLPGPLWFMPRKGTSNGKLVPFMHGISYQQRNISCSAEQEFCPVQRKLLASFVQVKVKINENEFASGYLFQDVATARVRRLLGQAPHTFFLKARVPLKRGVCLSYGGFFTAEQNVIGWGGLKLSPLKHELRLEYRGHCWGLYLGVEAKNYRQYGYDTSDKIFVLSVYVDSLGSFAKKIKSNNDQDSALVFK